MIIVNKTTLQKVSEYEFRQLHPNTSFPSTLSNEALEDTDYTIITPPERPATSEYQVATLSDPYKYAGLIKVRWDVETVVPPVEELLKKYETAIDQLIDSKAKEYKYNNVYTMISYRNDPNNKFASEAESMFLWRSAVWTTANQILSLWLVELQGNSNLLPPSVEDVLAELPEFELLP